MAVDADTFFFTQGHDALTLSKTFEAPYALQTLTISWKIGAATKRVLVLLSPSIDGAADWYIGAKEATASPGNQWQVALGGHVARRMRVVLTDAEQWFWPKACVLGLDPARSHPQLLAYPQLSI